jgi:hypothetical protein
VKALVQRKKGQERSPDMSEAGFGNGASGYCCKSTTFGASCPRAGMIERLAEEIAKTKAKANDN